MADCCFAPASRHLCSRGQADSGPSVEGAEVQLGPACRQTQHPVGYHLWGLQTHIPEWADVEIRPLAIHLGFYLGPPVDGDDFAELIKKLKLRPKMIAESTMPPAQVAMCFNSRAATVLGYISELSPPPAAISAIETWCGNETSRLPGHTDESIDGWTT